MRVLLVLPILVACAQVHTETLVEPQPLFELTRATLDIDAPPPTPYDIGAPVSVQEVSRVEAAAFKAEAQRLQAHSEPNCRQLAGAIAAHLEDVMMYERAIVRFVGPYKFYGVGHSYESDGKWVIRIARRLDELNPRTLSDELRTLRHETSHTLGASEWRIGDEWSAYDYAERCR